MKKEKAIRPSVSQPGFARQLFNIVMAVSCVALLSPGNYVALAQQTEPQNAAPASEAPKIPKDQLDSLVAPIALYPDPLLAQTLAASTYPLEVIQLQQWVEKNKSLKDKALADAVAKQNWDPSIQAMAAFPDVVKRLGDNVQWTTDLGNAFLAQQADVMDAVQRMRAKAQGTGNLKTSQQQKVETRTDEGKQVIVIDQASPNVIYVPSYNPTVVYGAPVYPYPSIYYPPPGYYAAGAAIAFGAGVALGAAWGGGWGWGCGWGRGDVNVNINNKYVNNWNKNNYNKANFNKANFNQGNFNKANINSGKWQHNPQHRGGAPYNRASASQIQSQLSARERGAGTGNIAGNRPGAGGSGTDRMANRPGVGGTGTNKMAGNRPGGGGGAGTMAGNRGGGGGGDRIGNRQVSGSSGGKGSGAFGGGGMNRGSAMASHNRGASSMGAARGGGGGHRGGGGRRR
jgi:Protein of unknown function (DUF3300)